MTGGRSILRELEEGRLAAEAALVALKDEADRAPTWAAKLDACRDLGALAGRAHGTPWPIAERAAFVLLEVARETDASIERVQILSAIGRGYRNVWLMPYVHVRLGDDDPSIVEAAIAAAGGLGFPALEEAIAADFLGDEVAPSLRLAAIAALGRMGAESAADRLAPFVEKAGREALAALAALTEIRSRAGESAAVALLDREPTPDLLAACVRYLAEVGHPRTERAIRRLARDDEAAQRIASSRAARAYHLERASDAAERILAALTETDRAARAGLARRLRTLPVDDVLAQATLLLSDDPEGIVQVLSEVRAPEVTRMLLALAADDGMPLAVRVRAAGSIEADEPWEKDALVDLVASSRATPVRVAATQTIGAFASVAFVLERLGALAEDRAPELRAALLWALQLAARPARLGGSERSRAEELVRRALVDEDGSVRRRAAYVAGNLDARSLVPELLALARSESENADLRLAAFVGLSEIASEERVADLVSLFHREDDPAALSALSRALERAAGSAQGSADGSLSRTRDRMPKLVAHADARARAAAARLAGLAPDVLSPSALVALAGDASPRVRQAAVAALGRIGRRAEHAEVVGTALIAALDDDDAVIQERAADQLLALAQPASLRAVLEYVTETADEAASARIAARLTLPSEPSTLLDALGPVLARMDHDHPAYETLLELKIDALDALRPRDAPRERGNVDGDIAALFPAWPRLSAVRGFAPLAKSLRTAELLYASAAAADGDQSASIVLWTKSLEGYLHAWLSPRLATLQRQPGALYELTARLGTAWPSYQRWVGARWTDPVSVGGLSIDVPLRATVNVLRDLGERRPKPVDSPMSVTEWARLMMFLAVDHPAGPKNLLEVTCRDPDHAVRLSHRLQVIALVRNTVTHRSVAATSTLDAFRSLYYAAFEDVTRMA